MPYIGLLIAILIIIFQGTIRKYTADYVGNWLISSLKDSTEGKYTLDYDFVRFDIFTKELRIQNFDLSLDTAVINQEEYLEQYSNLIDLSTPLIVLKLESIWDLLVNEKLRIAYIGMQEPGIKLIKSQQLTQEENEENQQEATEKIRSYLEELEIDSFRILNGSIHFDLQDELHEGLVDFRIRNFSTLLRGFKIDEVSPDKLLQGLYAEELELEILDQEISFPRLHHKLNFERLWVSSVDSLIQLDTLKIQSLESADSSLIGDFSLDKLALNGIDFKRAYEENIFDAKKVEINNPDLSLVKKGVSGNSNSISGTITLPFEKILLHEILLNDGRIDLSMKRKIASGHINASVTDYVIDSSMIAFEDLAKSWSDFSFSSESNSIELPDSIHQVKIGGLTINSEDSIALISNLQVSPISSRRNYKLYKERGVNLINYSSIRAIYLTGIDFNQAIHNQQYLIDSVHIISPSSNLTEYPYIVPKFQEQGKLEFLIKKLTLFNGVINHNRRQYGQNHRSQLQGISLSISNLFPDGDNPVAFDNLNLLVQEGFSEIKPLAHTIKFRNLESNNLTGLDIEELTFTPDSSSIESQKINFNASNLRVRGFSQEQLKLGTLKLDELTAESFSLFADLTTFKKSNAGPNPLNRAIINKFYFDKGDIKVITKENEVSFSNVSTLIDSLHYDAIDYARAVPIDFKDMLLSHGEFTFKSKKDKTILSGRLGRFTETDSLINFEDLTFKKGDNIQGRLKEIYLTGFDRNAFLVENGLSFNYLFLDQPNLEIEIVQKSKVQLTLSNDSIRNAVLRQFSYIKFDSILNRNANIKLSSANRITEIEDLNFIIRDYLCDTTTSAIDVLQPNEALLNIANISTKGINDTLSVQSLSLDMINNTLFTGIIDVSAHQKRSHIQIQVPGLVANGFSSSSLLNGDYSMDTIRFSRVNVHLTTYDTTNTTIIIKGLNKEMEKSIQSLFKKSKNLMFDSIFKKENNVLDIGHVELDSNKNINFKDILSNLKLDRKKDSVESAPPLIVLEDSLVKVSINKKAVPTHGTINYIGLHNSSFKWLQNNKEHGFLSDLDFNIDVYKLLLDTLNDFNVYNHIQDLSVKIKDYSKNMPDSLNTISFDELLLSTQDESISIDNISITPRVDKYDYAAKVGHQAGWNNLQNMDIHLEKLDMFRLLSERVVHIKKIKTTNGYLDIFKDKELPIPVNQRRPMLQDMIRNIDLPFQIDSIEVENFKVDFASRLSSEMPEGSLDFYDMNALVTNLVNIDTVISKNPKLNITASTKIMNKGLLSANFSFDMGDENNPFNFDAHLTTMSATDFNSLLEALAFVSVSSGTVKDLSMQATGDDYYATGNMTFLYNDLKVSTINKKNLKTKGMGKVMKTFFANAFVVKKNNPAFKFFPRDGAMYYERDPQKIIIDYVTKTALSGVVSSIGARNARKDIKKIQKESKKQKDAERKALKKASKRSIP